MSTEQEVRFFFFPEKQVLKERFYVVVIVGEDLNSSP